MKEYDSFFVWWEDDEYDRLVKTPYTLKHSSYTINPIAEWKPVVADETIRVTSGVPVLIKVRKITMPKNTMCLPLKIVRNGLGSLLSTFAAGISKGIESDRVFNKVVFLPIFNGEIQKGDLLGILLVYYTDAGISSFSGWSEEEKKREEVCFVYWKNGELIREPVEITHTSYFQSFVYEWMPIISAENVDVKKGQLKIIKTIKFEAPGNTVFDSLFIMRNAIGDVIDVFQRGKPRKIENAREISEVLFLPVRDGRILKGDLLNAAALHHVVVDKPSFRSVKFETQANLVYLDKDAINRAEVKLSPYGHYEGTAKERLEPVVSEETKDVQRGKVTSIKIKDLNLKPGTVVSPIGATSHALGVLLDIYRKGKPRKIECSQKLTHAIFLPIFDGKVKSGEVIGILRIHDVEVTNVDKLVKMLEKFAHRFSMSPGQFTTSQEWPHLWRKQ